MKGSGKRFDEGKIRMDLVPPYAHQQLARVLTLGAEKYGKDNYRNGMAWSKVIASLERHLNAFKFGEDFDKESSINHAAHIMCNAAFLLEYSKIYPQGDDRQHSYLTAPKVGLDIDGVLADFSGAYRKVLKSKGIKLRENQVHWEFSYNDGPIWEEVKQDKDFWLSLKPLCDPHLPFEPQSYVTSRSIPNEWTEEWLEKNGFPCEPVFSVGKESKAEAIKKSGAEIFVDDCFENFLDLNRQGICTYLLDKPYNQKYDVGFKRVRELKDLLG